MVVLFGLCAHLLVGQTPAPAPNPVLSFKDGVFDIVAGGKRERVPIKESRPTPPQKFLLRSGDTVVALDERGVTIQRGSRARSTRLGDFVTSPRFFDRETIVARVGRITKGEMSREYAAVSGYEQIDNNLYIAVRWEDKKKVAWQEALLRVELDGTSLLPEILTPLSGLSVATGSLDDKMYAVGSGIGVLTRQEAAWGLETWSLGMSNTAFAPISEGEPTVTFVQGGKLMLFVNKTAYGPYQAGSVRLPSGDRTLYTESRTPMRFVGDRPTVVRMEDTKAVTLRSLSSGLELVLPKDVGVTTSTGGVLVWTPAKAPVAAVLYDADSLRAISRWNAPKPTPTRRT